MLQRNTSILWRELDGEAVLLSPSAGSSYNLNPVGTFIWKLLDGQHTQTDIANAICAVYEVEFDQALQDIETILTELRTNNLLSEVPGTQPVK